MMSASSGVIIGVREPLECCKVVISGRLLEPELGRLARALRMDRTARKSGRRSLKRWGLQASHFRG